MAVLCVCFVGSAVYALSMIEAAKISFDCNILF